MNEIGSRMTRTLCALRIFSAMSQEQVALGMHESQASISEVERGKRDLTMTFAPRYVESCGGLDQIDAHIDSLHVLRSLLLAAQRAPGVPKEYRVNAGRSKAVARSG